MEWITSRKNPLLTQIRKLASGSGRDRREAGEYLGDGRKLLEEALKWRAPLTTVVVSEGVELPALPSEVRAVQVPRDVMETISPMKTPQGALFLVRLPETEPPEILTGDRYLVLDGVQDPGNVGTIWRTADALGADGLILVGNLRRTPAACAPCWSAPAFPCPPPPCGRTRSPWSRRVWTGRRWSLAARGAGSLRNCSPAASRPSRSPCGRGASP